MADPVYSGTLIVQISSAFAAVPVEGATVAVRIIENGVPAIFSVMTTGESGKTPPLEIPAPDPALSLSPGSVKPYSVVNIEAAADGYYGYAAINVPIFAGQVALQRINMIPVPDSDGFSTRPETNVIVNESEAPNL